MSSIIVLITLLLYIAIPVAFLYVVYRMVDIWVDKSLTVRREQNMLLAKLIDGLEKKDNESDTDRNTKP